MANIARLGVALGIDSAEFTKGIADSKKSVSDFASSTASKLGLAATAGVAAFSAMAYKALEFSDRISDLADASEMSIEKILKISNALEMSGGKSEDASKAIIKFTENIDKAALGSKDLQDQFARVGVSLDDLRKLSSEQLFDKTVDGVTKLGDVATMTGSKMALFGKGMRNIGMNQFNDSLKQGTEEYKRYAASIAIAADLNDKLAAKAEKTALTFTLQLAPVLNGLFDQANKKGGFLETLFEKIGDLIVWMSATATKAWGGLHVIFEGFTNWGEEGAKRVSKLAKEYQDAAAEIEKLYDRNKNKLPPPPDPKGGNRNVTPAKDPEAEKLALMLGMAQKISFEYAEHLRLANEMQAQQDKLLGLTDDERKVQEAINQVLNQTAAKVLEIERKKEEARLHGGNQAIIDEYDRQIEKVKELGAQYSDMAKNHTLQTNEVQRTFEFGWNKAFRQFGEDATNYANVAKDMFSAMAGAMGKAIDNFVDNGKFSFSDFASSVIKDLIKIQLKMQAMKLFELGVKAVTGAFSGGGLEGATTTGFGTTAGGEGATAFPISNGYASGGEITSPSIVGERGPELFIPDRSGAIIPNRNIGDYMGGGGGVTYNGTVIQNMQAIDTQSGLEFLAKNKMNIYALNQSASRSMPTSR